MKLKQKFIAGVTALMAFVIIGVGTMLAFSERQLLREELRQQEGQLIERIAAVCRESIYQNDFVLLNYLTTLKSERGFREADFIDSSGRIRVSSIPDRVGQLFQSSREAEAETSRGIFVQSYKGSSGEMFMDFAAPVFYAGGRAGTARLLLSSDDLRSFVNESLRRVLKRIGVILAAALIVGFLGALWLAGTMTKPIERIVVGMRQVSKGRLDSIPLPDRRDELGWLGQEINATIEKLRELEEMKRNFFSRITHDLRSPLSAIRGLVTMLLNGHHTSNPSDLLLTAQNHADRLTRLIDDLLTMSKLEAGRDEMNLSLFDVNDCVREVAELFFSQSQEAGIPLRADLSERKLLIRADRDKIFHVLTNLVSNAFKFTKKGSVTLAVQPEESGVTIVVADTGVGIPPQERDKIFDKYFRSPSARAVKGTGLGLHIVKMLLHEHGGRILVSGNSGGGSRFAATIPFQPPEKPL